MSGQSTPMDLLKHVAPEFAQNQMDEKALLFEHADYQQIPAKYKILIGIAVAAGLGCEKCTEMWTHQAKAKDVSNREIVEALMVARFMKRATVNATIASTLAGLTK